MMHNLHEEVLLCYANLESLFCFEASSMMHNLHVGVLLCYANLESLFCFVQSAYCSSQLKKGMLAPKASVN